MPLPLDRHVEITENGRSGTVVYHDPAGSLTFYWEFGGGDVVVVLQVSDRAAWNSGNSWFNARRSEILRYVADEVIRQKAPHCHAEINTGKGELLLKQTGPPPPPRSAPEVSFVRRLNVLKAVLGIIVLFVALIFGGVMWFKDKVLSMEPGKGVPLGLCVRTDTHIATLLQHTDPHLPEISGRGGNTTTSISILLIPLDGAKPRIVHVARGLDGGSYGLASIMGSDGRTLWLDCAGLYGVRLNDYELISMEDLGAANPSIDRGWWEDTRGMDVIDGRLHIMRIDRSAALDLDPATWKALPVPPKVKNDGFHRYGIMDQQAAGFIASHGTWLGLHAQEELDGEFKVKAWIRSVEAAEDAKRQRRFCTAELEPSIEGHHYRILSMAPISDTEYLNAAFLRTDEKSEPVRMSDPDGALMIYTSEPGLNGRLMVARVDIKGNIIWQVDTGLDRFKLAQILPGKDSFAFVGTGPPVPDKLSEPLLVIVENSTGRMRTHSLWP